jgi:hypothetical protein
MSSDDEKPPGPPPGPDEEISMIDVTDPRETDVLCGRGGAALRHPGNQTYRRLVNLNKGLYITCLKTEKLKISRSIVAAIREQKGRFLERDAKRGTWYDIGDKKAIEKTSQALREGQPKLRAKMVEMGQIPPEDGVEMSVQQQLGNGIYAPRQTPSLNSLGSIGSMASIGSFSAPNPYAIHSHMGSITSIGSRQPSLTQDTMPPPPSRTLSNNMNMSDEMMMMQRLSLSGQSGPSSVPSWTPSITSMNAAMMDESQIRSARNRMRASMNSHMGMPQSTMSMMSDISAFSGLASERQIDLEFPMGDRVGSLDSMQMANQQQQQQQLQLRQLQQNRQNSGASAFLDNPLSPTPLPPSTMKETSPSNRFDRRRFFAKMKARPGSARNAGHSTRSINDGMPDIHMVDSTFSLLSNLSGHGSRHHSNMDVSAHRDAKEGHKESMGSEYIGVGSRRSLMSGMSKLSNHSDHFNNPFADMSKKLGGMTNHSVRSVAMSEISGIEEEGDFAEDDMDEFSFDLPPARAPAL